MQKFQVHKKVFGPYALNYIDQGEGEVMIFLHNGGGFWQIWEHQLSYFSQTHRVIAPDWYGFGESAESEHFLTMDLLYDVLVQFVDGLGLKRFSLVGNCIGASLALKYQQEFPEKVKKLILFNVCPGKRILKNTFFRWFIPQLRYRPGLEKRARPFLVFLFRRKLMNRFFPRILFGEQVDRQSGLYQHYVGKYQQLRQNLSRANLLFSVDTYTLSRFFKANSTTDALLIWGEANRVANLPKEGQFHRDQIKPQDFVVISEAGHLCMYEEPETVNSLIEAYINETDSKSIAAQ